jgi:2'-5' RNA ligase
MQSHFAVSHTGIIVTVEPTMDEKQQIALPDGEPVSHLHVTLAHLGDVETAAPDRDAVVDACKDVASWFAPMTGELTGLGTFGPPSAMSNHRSRCWTWWG